MNKDKLDKEDLFDKELLDEDYEGDIEKERKRFEESLTLQELELILEQENKSGLSSPYKNKYKKLNNTLLISAILFAIILLGGMFATKYLFTQNSVQNEVVISNVLQMAVEKAYRETKVYPIDVNRRINIKYLEAEGYINIDVESITDKEFYLDNNNKVQVREKSK